MPLSQPTSRQLLHLRDIQLRGYLRDDGLVDVEAHLTDTKTYSWGNRDRGKINAGEALHGMWLRVTINQTMTIESCEASMEFTPYTVCPGVAPNYARLAGLSISKGFIKGAMERVGGTEGCTHLRELLQQIGTVAFQTMYSIRGHLTADSTAPVTEQMVVPKALLNTCYAYDENGPLVARAKVVEAATKQAAE